MHKASRNRIISKLGRNAIDRNDVQYFSQFLDQKNMSRGSNTFNELILKEEFPNVKELVQCCS